MSAEQIENQKARAYEIAAEWHDARARGAREIADDIRVGDDIQAKAGYAAKHRAASAAGLRLSALESRRKALLRLASA